MGNKFTGHKILWAIIPPALVIAFGFFLYSRFHVWWRSAIYLDSFDDAHDPYEAWGGKVRRLLAKERKKRPVDYVVFRACLGLVEGVTRVKERFGKMPLKERGMSPKINTMRDDGSLEMQQRVRS